MRVVLVGAGRHAMIHLLAWRKVPGVQVIVVARRPERLAEVAAEYGAETSTDLDAALDGADRADICTPPDTHAHLARRALAAGVPTIVEKPAARTVDEALALADSAGSVPLACMLNNRYSKLWRRARDLVRMRLIGDPLISLWPVLADNRRLFEAPDFRADAARGGGVLLDGAIHLIDLIPWVLSQPLVAATPWLGHLSSQPPAGEDTALVSFEHVGGVAQLIYSWSVPLPTRLPAATLIGTEGTLLVPRSAKLPFELIRDRETIEHGMGEYTNMSRNDLGNAIARFAEDPAAAAAETWEQAIAAQTVVERCEAAANTGICRVEL